MTWRILSLALVAFLAFAGQPAVARLVSFDSDADVDADAPAAVLRSAFFLRSSGRDQAALAATAQERRFHIQRHFDVVLATLAAGSARSLDLALARLESARGENWTDDQRDAWLQTLAHRRLVNIRRLRLYQLRGQFPQNEHVANRAVPIFVDNHDTACAVGHLMRKSDWGDAVAAIQRANNFVYVTDVREGSLVDWVLVSGLTQEEAALIQPSYYPPMFDAGFDLLTQGGAITKNGLHFENFHFIAGELSDPDSFPDVPPPANQVDLAGYGAAVRQGAFQGLGQAIDPIFDDWLFTGARNEAYSIVSENDPWGILYSFDVMPVDPGHRLVAVSLESFRANYNFVGVGLLEIDASIFASGSSGTPALAELSLNADPLPGQFVGDDSAAIGHQQKITVVTAIRLEGGAVFTSIVHSFQLAPEPTAMGLAGLACAAAMTLRRRTSPQARYSQT